MPKQVSFDYAAKMAELEGLLARLQDPTTPLDEAMKLHAAGQILIHEIEDFLKHAENEVQTHVAKGE